jgi:two-component system cell cycle response regulator CpdR
LREDLGDRGARGLEMAPTSSCAVVLMTPLYVLVAEDEPEISNLITRWLEHDGHHVTCAANGAEATSISQAKEFDLVVTDMLMPEIDGMQLIAVIKKSHPKTRILAISGGGHALDGLDCLRMAKAMGADAAVKKPFRRASFMEGVTAAMAPKASKGLLG